MNLRKEIAESMLHFLIDIDSECSREFSENSGTGFDKWDRDTLSKYQFENEDYYKCITDMAIEATKIYFKIKNMENYQIEIYFNPVC